MTVLAFSSGPRSARSLWTHAGYPLAAAGLARVRRRPVHAAPETPSVTVIVAAHDEEPVIERRLENLLALDYPPDRLEIVVASDASTDRTDELVEAVAAREPRVRLIRCPRGGKVAAQDRAVRETARRDRSPSPTRTRPGRPTRSASSSANFADPDVAYVCGRLRAHRRRRLEPRGRLLALRDVAARRSESALGSVTGGNGSIYAVRRSDYVEVDPRFGHDLSLPYLMVQRGRRAVYDPEALAFEKPTPEIETEYRRKVRMFEHCWLIVLRGRMLRRLPPGYLVEILSHRHLRYGSGLLHLVLLGTNVALVAVAPAASTTSRSASSSRSSRSPRRGAGLPRYYTLVTWATVVSLWNYLRRGVPATWEPGAHAMRDEPSRSASTSTSAGRSSRRTATSTAASTLTRYPIPAFPLGRARGGRSSTSAPTGAAGRSPPPRRLPRDRDRPGAEGDRRGPARRRAARRRRRVRRRRRARPAVRRTRSFDVVFSYSVLQHLSKEDVRRVVAEIGRVLRPGGTAWIEMPNAHGPLNLVRRAGAAFASRQRPRRPLLDARRAARGLRARSARSSSRPTAS